MRTNESLERFRDEYASLLRLERRSRFIKVTPLDLSPGSPPNHYLITYSCRGIAGIDKNQAPIISDNHQVEIYLDHDFPSSEPTLTWQTPIWHPNIEHLGDHTVCTDNIRSWYPTRSLDQLVVAMGEMIQYKKYHAKWEPPYPIDEDVAKWVADVAEKKGIVGPGKPFDKRALTRKVLDPIGNKPKKPRVIIVKPAESARRRVTLRPRTNTEG